MKEEVFAMYTDGAFKAKLVPDKPKAQRPRTSPGHHTISSPSFQLTQSKDHDPCVNDEEDEQFELLEYEWPDLPPLPSMKDAVSRRRVSQGISYLLPVDKGRNSINNRFRTDLRAMFQEPYASDNLQYDDSRVKLSAKIHFLSNTADTKWTHQHLHALPTQVSADCEGARKLFVHSAPVKRMPKRGTSLEQNLRKRSNLFLPVKARKAQVSPDITKLREEAAEIIRQGLSYTDDEEILREPTGGPNDHVFTTSNSDRFSRPHPFILRDVSDCMLTTFGGSHLSNTFTASSFNTKSKTAYLQQQTFAKYEDLKSSVPPKFTMPLQFQSSFLSSEENQRVWEWLHYGETLSEFDYFLSICG